MQGNFLRLASFIFIFTLFNFVISVMYYICSRIILKKAEEALPKSSLTVEQREFLLKNNFVNVQREWTRSLGIKLKAFSKIYFLMSEVLCASLGYMLKDLVLVCRFSVASALLLFIILVGIMIYTRRESKKQREMHLSNMRVALNDFENLTEDADAE